jgi:hypothetical protein
VRVLPHIKRLDDCFGDFLVRVVCECGACREITPQALARLVGWPFAAIAERRRRTGLQVLGFGRHRRTNVHAQLRRLHRESVAIDVPIGVGVTR